MVDFFDKLLSSIENRYKLLIKLRYYGILRFIIKNAANILIPIYFKIFKNKSEYKLTSNVNHGPLYIVTLTTYPKRIKNLWLVIETILRQSRKPDKIILWLSIDQFPSIDHLPKRLLEQRSRGLEIILKEENLRSHKKYLYSLQHFPNETLITIDDDIFYPTNMLENLIHYHKIFPDAIIAHYGFEILIKDNLISPYSTWKADFFQDSPDYLTFFGSGGGTLFPPNSLPEITLDKRIIFDLCLYADDIWLNTVIRYNNKKIFRIPKNKNSILPIFNKNDTPLSDINLAGNFNDKQLKDIRCYFLNEKSTDPYQVILNEN